MSKRHARPKRQLECDTTYIDSKSFVVTILYQYRDYNFLNPANSITSK